MARDLNSPRYTKLREMIVASRKGAGLSQGAVAQRLGRPQSYIADIERSERRIDVIEFVALGEAIGFDCSSILRAVVAERAD